MVSLDFSKRNPIIKYLKKILIPLIIIIFTGCSSSTYFIEQESPVVTETPFFKGPQILGISKRAVNEAPDNDNILINYFLRSLISKTDTTIYNQVYIQIKNQGINSNWGFYHQAKLENGDNLKLQSISRDVSCSSYGYTCTYLEEVAVKIPIDILQKSPSDLILTVYGESENSFSLKVTPQQISAQLEQLNDLISRSTL